MQALFSQLPVGTQEDEAGGEECKNIRGGHGVQNAHQSEHPRQQHHKRPDQQRDGSWQGKLQHQPAERGCAERGVLFFFHFVFLQT